MATYKMIQDIEAEDHILGPLTLRQFIFALIAVFFFYISFLLVSKHVAFLLIIFFPPGLFFGFFAIPFGRDQPTEIWALAKIRFFLKPRKRIWDQSGIKELVTITVPKKIERVLTDGLNPYEVESRLTALASTLDSRGWAVKNVNIGTVNSTNAYMPNNNDDDASDRLINMGSVPEAVPDDQIPASAVILDEANNPVAQQFQQMIVESSQAHRQQLIQQMNSTVSTPSQAFPAQPISTSTPADDQWFMPHVDNLSSSPTITAPDVSAQVETPEEEALAEQIKSKKKKQQLYHSNLRTLQPLGTQANPTPQASLPQSNQLNTPIADNSGPLTSQPDPAIIFLASNNDFNVETIAREAKRSQDDGTLNEEVVISLH